MKDTVGQFLIGVFLVAISLSIPFILVQPRTSYATSYSKIAGQTTVDKQKDVGNPNRLKIPSIGVDADIESVGVTPDGLMGVPVNNIDVGWFNLGPRPGERGSAVIAGHLDGTNGEEAVFSNLNKLKMGDKVYVVDENGNTVSFTVEGNQEYDVGYADEIFSRNDGTYFNLITCDGIWDGIKKSYSKRLVVFTTIDN